MRILLLQIALGLLHWRESERRKRETEWEARSEMLPLCKLIIIFLILNYGLRSCNGRIFSFEMHHRFSEPFQKWSEAAGALSPAGNLPEKGTFEYYAELADRDRLLRGRKLSEADGPLAFSGGNSTIQISSLGLYVYCIPWIWGFFFFFLSSCN